MTDNIKNEELQAFGDDEFVFTQDANKKIVGGGYKVNSLFLQGGLPPLTTFNTADQNQDGGKVSSPFENLAVPAGLFYINQRVPKYGDKEDHHYKKHETISDDMIDKLYSLVNADKKKQRKTRKQTNNPSTKPTKSNKSDKNTNKKTRKHNVKANS